MSDAIFPTQIPNGSPTADDRIMFSDITDSEATKDCAISELPISTAMQSALDNKVDKISGKGLSEADFTVDEKNKLRNIFPGAKLISVVAGTNVTVNNSDPQNPIVGVIPGTGLGDMLKSENLSGLNNATARSNIDVYSKGEINSLASNYATNTALSTGLGTKANLAGGNTFSGEQIIDGQVYIKGGGTGPSAGNGLHVWFDTSTDEATISGFHAGVDWRKIKYNGKSHSFLTNDNERFSIANNGDLVVNGQNWTSAWTSYTPVVSGSGGSGTMDIGFAKYKQIGKTCFVKFKIQVTNKNTLTGDVSISLPFATVGDVYCPINGFCVANGQNPRTQAKGDAETDNTGIVRFKQGFNTAWLSWSAVSNTDWFVVNGTYETV